MHIFNRFSSSAISSLTVIIFLFIFSSVLFCQTNSRPEYLSLLDSVKTYYGDTCCVGIKSNIIQRLYKYETDTTIRNYLSVYEALVKKINNFRSTYHKEIYDEPAMLLDISRIFDNKRQQNILNACSIYLGPDSVTSVALSYVILRCSPQKFYSQIYQVSNFDPAFRHEISNFGDEWYNSLKLNRIIEFPLK